MRLVRHLGRVTSDPELLILTKSRATPPAIAFARAADGTLFVPAFRDEAALLRFEPGGGPTYSVPLSVLRQMARDNGFGLIINPGSDDRTVVEIGTITEPPASASMSGDGFRRRRAVIALAMLVAVVGILVAAWLDSERFLGNVPGRLVTAALGSVAAAAIWIASGASLRVIAAWFIPATVLLMAGYMLPGPAGYVVVAGTGIALGVLTFSNRVRAAWFARLPAILRE
jgi:hypothetical protein